jgi:hypothetical protein
MEAFSIATEIKTDALGGKSARISIRAALWHGLLDDLKLTICTEWSSNGINWLNEGVSIRW